MSLPEWKELPVRVRRSRKKLHNLLADEFGFAKWTELNIQIRDSKRKLYDYYAKQLNLKKYRKLLKTQLRSTREYYNYLRDNADPEHKTDTLRITVSDSDGAVGGANVKISDDTDEYSATTNRNGVVEFQVAYGDYTAVISKNGYHTATQNIAFRSNHKNFSVTIEQETILTFTVLDELNAPIEGVYVKIGDDIDGRTGADGKVSFDVEYGSYDYAMSKDGYKTARGSITFDEEHTEFNVVMEYEAGHILTINVTDETDNPLENVYVVVGHDHTGRTDENGDISFILDYDTYTYSMSKEGYKITRGSITFDSEHTSFTVVMESDIEPPLTFTVLNENDNPIEEAIVQISRDGSVTKTGRTNSEGKISFQDVPYADYGYAVTKEYYKTARGTVTFDEEHTSFTVVMESEFVGNVMSIVWDSSESATINTDTDRGDGIILSDDCTAVIEWGDGTTTDFDYPIDFEHTYEESGTYTVNVTILDGVVERLGRYCFSERTGLKSISFPAGLDHLEESAFRDCTNLESVTFDKDEDTLSFFDRYVFYNCEKLTSISIPDSLTELGQNCFEYCKGLSDVRLSINLTTLPSSCFLGCESLTEFYTPADVTVINNYCFEGCTSLETFVGCSSLESIEGNCFYNCTSLVNVNLGENITFLGAYNFVGCESLTTIALPSGIDYVNDSLFEHSGLESIEIPANVIGLGESSFENCTNLESITFSGDNVTEICDYCFEGCTSLDNVDLPDSITSVGDSAFNGCTGLTTINLPNSITSMGAACFMGCTNLPRINIPTGLTSLEDNLFRNCKKLNTVTIPGSITSLGVGCFQSCIALTSINIPNSVTEMGNYCFAYCTALTNISMSQNTHDIGAYCFTECPITSLSIPDSVTTMDRIIYNCLRLTTLDLYWEENVIPFAGSYDTETLNWPSITINIPHDCWMDYASKGYPETSLHERDE